MLNHNKLFIKAPINLECSIHDRKLYVAYLWFKVINKDGCFHNWIIQGEDRFFNKYWLNKLIEKGWVIKNGDDYKMVAYQQVWRELGVTRLRGKYKYRKLDDSYTKLTRKQFMSKVLVDIQKYVAERKVKQFKHRLLKSEGSERTTNRNPYLSCYSSAKLFGYSSTMSGKKYRKEFFKLVSRGDKPKVSAYCVQGGSNIIKVVRAECDRIIL